MATVSTPSTARQIKDPKTRFNWRVSDFLRQTLVHLHETRAKITGRGYYCGALVGDSEYGITINSDMTVSCSCQDYDGSGHLGDLKKNTFAEVFHGPVAQKFQADLLKGKIPIPTCTRCGDLRRLTKENPAPLPTRLPHKGMLLENTVICNVDCIGCARESAAEIRSMKVMPLDKLSQMADLAASLGMEQIFYLNLGEPFLSPRVAEELPLLRQKNPNARIIISSNGVLLNSDAKREAALSVSQILFSVHGISDAMCEKYMRKSSFEKAYAAMRDMVKYRDAKGAKKPILEWKYLLFNWNDHPQHLTRAIEMAKEIGVDIISFWPTNNPYYGKSWRNSLGLLNNFGEKCWKGREIILRPENVPAGERH